MAALPSLVFILGMCTANAVSIVADGKAAPSVIRRENQAMHLDSTGKMQSLTQAEDHFKSTQCNGQFVLMAEGTDECTGSGKMHEVHLQDDCKRAATALSKSAASNNEFDMNTHQVAELPYPKGCFLKTDNDLVYMNPTAPVPVNGTSGGRKICERRKYVKGSNFTDSATACAADGDGVAIFGNGESSVDACMIAAKCVGGFNVCLRALFFDNVTCGEFADRPCYTSNTEPQGCFQDDVGCWNYNHIATAPTGVTSGTAVCHQAATQTTTSR